MKPEKKKRKSKIGIYILKGIPLFLAGTVLGLNLAYSNHSKLVELNNIRNYKVATFSCQTPYNIHILREAKGDTILTYVVNTRTNQKLIVNRDLKIGNFDYRLESLVGDKHDNESIVGKFEIIKDKTSNYLKEFYYSIKDFITKHTTKENEHK